MYDTDSMEYTSSSSPHNSIFLTMSSFHPNLATGERKTDSKSAVHFRKAKSIVPRLHSSCLTSSTVATFNNEVYSAQADG
jgi:hypothetical protein